MIDKRAIKKYKIRRDGRLKKRGVRLDVDWEEEKHPRAKDGKFTSGSGGEEKVERKTVKTSEPVKVKLNNTKSSGEYVDLLGKAKKSLSEADGAWRVTQYKDGGEFDDWHPGAKMYHTDGGSTVAVAKDGDIVGVCHHAGDSVRGKDLIKFAVENGGIKLDAYDGLFGFYTKCGFEPVSWCKWDEQFAPPDWRKGKDNPENIVFYKYTGGKTRYKDVDDFFAKVEASEDYDSAKNIRDKDVGK